MNVIGIPFAFVGIATIVTRRMVDESGTTAIEGHAAVLIGAILPTVGLVVTFFV